MKLLFGVAALLFATVCSAAPETPGAPDPSTCRPPVYPRESLRLLEDGVSLLGFLIRADGSVAGSVVLNSSGYADLDQAAKNALRKCSFKPVIEGGKTMEAWKPLAYTWVMDDDPELSRARRKAAEEAKKGDVDARYRLARLLFKTAKTDAERQRALAVLQSAADRGHPHAQYDLGTRYEKGTGVEADVEQARLWYQKAAEQGDVLPIQRLKLGKLIE